MFLKTFRTLIFILLPGLALGQSLDLSVSSRTADNNPSTYLLGDSEVTIKKGSLHFLDSASTMEGFAALGVSDDESVVSVLERSEKEGQMLLLSPAGDTLDSYSTISIGADDPSLAVYPFNNGGVLLQDNIANFTFYDAVGSIFTSMSSSSQSKEGEAISEVAMSQGGETLVIYNPKIKRSGELGSKAEVMVSGGGFESIFFSSDRYLKDITVSEDGNIIVAITAKNGTEDRVLIMDTYGNELNTISTDEDLIGATLTEDNDYLTLYSGGRVMVFSTLDGKRMGATSFRSTVFLADYFPEDDLILALTGRYSENSGIMNDAEFRAIDLGKRQIASKEFSAALGFHPAFQPGFNRIAPGRYQLRGANKQVEVRANF